MLLSVIVPVYNGEKYLSDCLASLSNQGFNEKEYEVIVVNDGSTDGTESIIDSFCKQAVFKKVNKANGGVSSARNLGIQEAKGEYIIFVDADDKVSENVFATIIRYMKENELDGYYFASGRDENKLKEQRELFDIEKDTLICKTKGPGGIHGVVYKKSVLQENQISFNTSMVNTEDLLFNFYYTVSTKKVGVTQVPFYYYRENNESVTRSLFKNRNSYGDLNSKEYKCYLSIFIFVQKVKEYRENNPDTPLCDYLISVMLGKIQWMGIRCFYEPKDVLNDIKEKGLTLNDIRLSQIKGKPFKQMVKSFINYSFKYPLIYKATSKIYRKMKS